MRRHAQGGVCPVETYFLGFGFSEVLYDGDWPRFKFLETLSVKDVRQLVEDGVEPCFDRRYRYAAAALRKRFRIRIATPGRIQATPQPGDYIVTVWIEPLRRFTQVDPCEFDEADIADADFTFTLEEAC